MEKNHMWNSTKNHTILPVSHPGMHIQPKNNYNNNDNEIGIKNWNTCPIKFIHRL